MTKAAQERVLYGVDSVRTDATVHQPGVMLYFDMMEPLKVLGYEDKGRLLEGIFEYGKYGVVPEFDGLLTVAWGFIRPKLDHDAKRYRERVVKNTYSSYCSKEKKEGRPCLEFEEWCAHKGIDAEGNRAVPYDIERCPTITPTTDTPAAPFARVSAKTMEKAVADEGGKGEEDSPKEKDFDALRRAALAKFDERR